MAIVDKVITDDFTMEYCKFGNGEKPFVIIPGISLKSVVASADAVEGQFKDFSNDFTVYLFDRKLNVKNDYSIKNMADDTAKAMTILGIENAVLYGVSQGGMIAQTIAINYPNLVSKLALASTVSRITPELENSLENGVLFAKNNKVNELVECFVDSIYSPQTLEKFRDYLINQCGDVSVENLEQFYYIAKGTSGFDVYNDLSKIECPVIVMGGKLDKVLGIQGAYDIAEKLDCECYVYDDYGHAVYDEAPDFLKRIYDYIIKV